MSCQCKNPNPPCVVTVTAAAAGVSAYTLTTGFDLSTLTANADFSLVISPGALAGDADNNPVVLTDGDTTLSLTMYNGNDMRETVFKRMVRRRSRCGRPASVPCFFGDDAPHVLVWPSRRY